MAYVPVWIEFAWLRIMPDLVNAQILCAGGFLERTWNRQSHRVFHDEHSNSYNVENEIAALQEYFSLQEINFRIEKLYEKFVEFKQKNICLV
ncbi:MAG: hypothetical protein U1A81_01790 [Hydrogenophaga sp.]|uniref:hypothetical protein n=1 Tax=Hydrogenophaga sp. TaxID=1904254 RepID=UPI002727E669|nr:hypothetical protein [Hydrogenophaga sp.]MDO9568222.1 hypothetical protein [Hydrogenophaga sp.]MDP3925410.1 hypothetical protein [Hydrogenophaga sp.]MDZ4236867.1 hypothetical protein [Hydrogenophaga sp.]